MTQLGSNDKSEDKGLTVPLEVPSLPVLSLPTLNSDYCFFTLLSQPRERAVCSFFTWSPIPGSKRARIGRKGNGLGVRPGGAPVVLRAVISVKPSLGDPKGKGLGEGSLFEGHLRKPSGGGKERCFADCWLP